MQPKTAAKFWKESFFVFNFLVNKLTISFLIGRKPTVKSAPVTSSSCRFYNLDFILNGKNARFLRSPTRNTPVSINCEHDVTYSSWTFALIIVFYANVCNILVGWQFKIFPKSCWKSREENLCRKAIQITSKTWHQRLAPTLHSKVSH